MVFDLRRIKCRMRPGSCPRCGVHSDRGLAVGARRVVQCGCDLSEQPFRQLMISLGGQIGNGDVYGFTAAGVCAEGCESCLIAHRPGSVDPEIEQTEPAGTQGVPGGLASTETI